MRKNEKICTFANRNIEIETNDKYKLKTGGHYEKLRKWS